MPFIKIADGDSYSKSETFF